MRRRVRRHLSQSKWSQSGKFIMAYEMAGYGSYGEYLASQEWKDKKIEINRKFPKSRYCWICDSKTKIDLHHENYWAIPKEKFLKDVFWLCRDCHTKVHVLETGARLPLEIEQLKIRRQVLRKKFVWQQLRATTLIYFLTRSLYRLLW